MSRPVRHLLVAALASAWLAVGGFEPVGAQPAPSPLSFKASRYLTEAGDTVVVAVVAYQPGARDAVLRRLNSQSAFPLDTIDAVILRVPASRLYAARQDADVVYIEPLDPNVGRLIGAMLLRAEELAHYAHTGQFPIGVINMSLGVPLDQLQRDLTADRTVRRMIQFLVKDRGVPVIIPIGNGGPAPGVLNPWALADGAIIATATDAAGTRVWPAASRGLPGELAGRHLFAAHGEDTIGPLHQGVEKTIEQRAAEQRIDMASIVGADNVDLYSVLSGTSFAAAKLSRCACYFHQAVQLLRANINYVHLPQFSPPAFVRGVIDSGIDQDHPAFKRRLADRRPKYVNIEYSVHTPLWQRLTSFLNDGENRVGLRVDYLPSTLIRFFKVAAIPVIGEREDTIGHGFVSERTIMAFLAEITMIDLVDIFLDANEPNYQSIRLAAQKYADEPLFPEEYLIRIDQYCRNYDLTLHLDIVDVQF